MTAPLQPGVARAERVFSRVVVGIDGSDEALDAARQGALLQVPDAAPTFLGAWTPIVPPVAPIATVPHYDVDYAGARSAAETAVHAARAEVPSGRALVVEGVAAVALLAEIEREEATLVAVGSHGHGRAAGIVLGSTATRLIHDAPCSVLLARPMPEWPPRRIAVGVDGSPESALALAAARYLAARFDADLSVVVAEGDEALDLAAVSLVAGDGFRVIPDDPVAVLVAASADTDLLVVGSRGLQGRRALGSVSERVAHRAACSTLVVREAASAS